MTSEQFPALCHYSVVVPMHNEEGNVAPLANALLAVMRALNEPFELIFVDDGSSDATFMALECLADLNPEICVLKLKRNFGQTPALAAGFDHAAGEIILAMDGDLRSDPADIPKLLEKLDENFDIVNGWRRDREHEGWLRTIPSRIANRWLASFSGVPIRDFGSTFKAYRREVVEGLRLYGEQHRYIPVLAAWQGARTTEVPVEDSPRQSGKSHYGIGRMFRVPFDLLALKFLSRFRMAPLRFFGPAAALSLFSGAILWSYLAAAWFWKSEAIASHAITAILGGVLLVGGIQLLGMGLLGEFLAFSHFASQREPIYRVERVVRRRDMLEVESLTRAKSARAGG